MAEINVIKGDSTKVKEFTIDGYPDISDAGWTGKKAVMSALGAVPTLNETMEKDSENTMFLGYLTPAETDALPVGEYVVVYEITNIAIIPLFRREKQYTLQVTQSGIPTV